MEPSFAQDLQMGKLVRSFGPNRANAKVLLYVIPVFALVGLIFFFSGFGRSRPGDAIAFIIGGLVFLLTAAALFWGYRRQLTARADVYEQGLLWKHWRGNQQIIRWEDVTAVYEFIGYDRYQRRAIQWTYTVCRKNGEPLKINMAVENIRVLGNMILNETGKRILPRVMDAYKTGGAAMLDDGLGLSRQGITIGGDVLPWEQIEKIHISFQGDLSVHKKEGRLPWKMLIHARIPTFPVFRVMLHHAVEGQLPGARPVLEDPTYKPS